jgi:hypothetical protein
MKTLLSTQPEVKFLFTPPRAIVKTIYQSRTITEIYTVQAINKIYAVQSNNYKDYTVQSIQS